MDRVLRGARPDFPTAAPPALVELAAACWAANPADRPAFRDICQRLQRLADALA
jgi:hypothetical protein